MVSERLKKVILNELEIKEFNIVDETTADQVPEWDSFNHINIIIAVEKEFGIKFKSTEILKINNVGELQQLIDSKLGNQS
jgi:acyl carrier protein